MTKCAAIFEIEKRHLLNLLKQKLSSMLLFIGLLNCLDKGITFSFLYNKMISVGYFTNMLYNIAAPSTWVYYKNDISRIFHKYAV